MSTTWQDRLWAKVSRRDDGCWIWLAALNADGYGQFHGARRKATGAHRWAYIATHGGLPDGLEVDHLCNVRACVNPDHLEAVTHKENQRRRAERQTHCLKGHEFTADNTRIRPDGKRRCRTCERDGTRRRRAVSLTP